MAESSSRRISAALCAVGSFLVGACLPLQAAVAMKLVDDGTPGFQLWAICLLTCGTSVAFGTLLFHGNKPRLGIEEIKENWSFGLAYLVGIMNALYFVAVMLMIAKIGFGMTFMWELAGKITMSAILDRTGLFDTPKRRFYLTNILGGVLVVVGTGVFLLSKLTKAEGISVNVEFVLYTIISFLAGNLIIVVTSWSRLIAKFAGSAFRGCFYVTSTGCLTSFIIAITFFPLPKLQCFGVGDLWKWGCSLVGLLKVVFLFSPEYVGFTVTIALAVLGQLVGSMVLDHFDFQFLGFGQHPIDGLRAGGVLIVVLGIIGIHKGKPQGFGFRHLRCLKKSAGNHPVNRQMADAVAVTMLEHDTPPPPPPPTCTV